LMPVTRVPDSCGENWPGLASLVAIVARWDAGKHRYEVLDLVR